MLHTGSVTCSVWLLHLDWDKLARKCPPYTSAKCNISRTLLHCKSWMKCTFQTSITSMWVRHWKTAAQGWPHVYMYPPVSMITACRTWWSWWGHWWSSHGWRPDLSPAALAGSPWPAVCPAPLWTGYNTKGSSSYMVVIRHIRDPIIKASTKHESQTARSHLC